MHSLARQELDLNYRDNKDYLHTHETAEVLNPESNFPILMTIEHACPNVPDDINLGVEPDEGTLPYFYDVGIPEVARHLANDLGATTIFGRFTRLVIDLNRNIDRDDLIAENEYWGIPIPGNTGLTQADKDYRFNKYYLDYHKTIAAHVERLKSIHNPPIFFSLHSYPRHERTVAEPYPWDFACLYNKDNRMAKIFMDHISENYPNVVIGDNEPYSLKEYQTGSAIMHGENNDLPYLLIEISIDKMQTEKDIAFWSKLIKKCLTKSISDILIAD